MLLAVSLEVGPGGGEIYAVEDLIIDNDVVVPAYELVRDDLVVRAAYSPRNVSLCAPHHP